MQAERQHQSPASKVATLRWFVISVVVLMAYWLVATNFVVRDFFDPQFSLKYELLRKSIAENPARPLWLVIGSSRVDQGLRPGLIENKTQTGESPLIFNFGMSGCDLFREYICLKRLLKDGIKPKRLGIEILTPILNVEESDFIQSPSLLVRARWDELEDYRRYTSFPAEMMGNWSESRIDPFYKWGWKAKGQTLPVLRIFGLSPALPKFGTSLYWDRWGWMPAIPDSVSHEKYLEGFGKARENFEAKWKDFKVTKPRERAMGDLLDLCKASGIEAYLLRMPESPDFQQLYPAQADAAIDAFLDRTTKKYGIKIINARTWIEMEGFQDGHHLTAKGAEKFTRRFTVELFKTEKHGSFINRQFRDTYGRTSQSDFATR